MDNFRHLDNCFYGLKTLFGKVLTDTDAAATTKAHAANRVFAIRRADEQMLIFRTSI
ncbi:hypothetical protein [Niabella ginsengisoli]|uniref:Uncharacterized protein n=1 Tax=Niabella ginsengisoli TaxID=522298 RepID=A0ABS9SJS6_9BACT|nr:hypothetical protein [Niabella ginsengisoli]MCH5598632.1 hypothetical protein [Niabella ginsengisoli]